MVGTATGTLDRIDSTKPQVILKWRELFESFILPRFPFLNLHFRQLSLPGLPGAVTTPEHY